MDIFEDAIVPETPKALPNEQLFIYVPIGTMDKPGIVTFDDVDFRIDKYGRVYMKVSPSQNAKGIRDIFALLYGYREGEPEEGEEPGPVMASVKVVEGKIETVEEELDDINTHISEIEDRLTTGGTILVSKSDWGDSERNVAVQIRLDHSVLKSGTLMVLAPANDATKQAVAEHSMSMKVDKTVNSTGSSVDVVVLERKPGKIPDVDLTFRYAVIVIGGDTAPTVTLVGGLGGNGDSNLYVGTGTPPSDAQIWINPEGDPAATEVWEFELESGDTETKSVVVLE